MKTAKKILLILLTFVVLFSSSASLFFAKPARAQLPQYFVNSTWFDTPNPFEWYVKVYDTGSTPADEIFGERYTAAQVQWILYSIPSIIFNDIVGSDVGVCLASLATSWDVSKCTDVIIKRSEKLINPFALNNNDSNYALRNTEGFSLKNFFQTRSVSGVGYVINKVQNFSITPKAKAQGFGYNVGANPVQKIWKASRDMCYTLLIFVVITLAFMIMFRIKLSPQTVVSVQSVLPKIIITLILITFSYAIAGFLIDLMYVIIGIISMFISQTEITNIGTVEIFQKLTDGHTILSLVWSWWIWFFMGSFSIPFFFGGLFSILFSLILILLATWFSVKIIWLTIKTFINVMLLIIIAPFEILLGAITQGMGIGPWMRKMFANLSVYPTIGLMFVLSFFFIRQVFDPTNRPVEKLLLDRYPLQINGGFLTPEAWQPPLSFGTNGAQFLWLMVSFGIFSMIPKVADIIKSMIERKPFDYGSAIGEAMGPGIGAGKQAGIGLVEQARTGSIRVPFTKKDVTLPSQVRKVAKGISRTAGRSGWWRPDSEN